MTSDHTAQSLLTKLAALPAGEFCVVNSGSLDSFAIGIAQSCGEWFVDDDALGYAIVRRALTATTQSAPAAAELSDEQLCAIATHLFPRWREDIQERFVIELGRGILRGYAPFAAHPPAAPVPAEPSDLQRILRGLAANAGGLRAFEPEVRQIIGNTNWQCIADYVAQADAVLASAPVQVPPSLAVGEAPEGWISVNDRLPPGHTDFIALNRDGRIFDSRMCYGMHEPWFTYPRGDGSPSNTVPDWIDVTHWMPKPAVPQETTK